MRLSIWRRRGGTDCGADVASAASVTGAVANAPEADVVVSHLVDLVDGARVTMPSLERGTWAMAAAWRKMPLAFHDLSRERKEDHDEHRAAHERDRSAMVRADGIGRAVDARRARLEHERR